MSKHEPGAEPTRHAAVSRRSLLKATAAAPVTFARAPGRKPHVAVVGAGAFGGWTALHLLRRGARVTLLDAWGPGHSRASSGGESRIIRGTYGPERIYVQMVVRALALWRENEKRWAHDNRIVITGGYDGVARLWDTATQLPIGPPLRHQGGVRGVAFSPDGSRVLTGSTDRTARLWDVATGRPIGVPLRHEYGGITDVAFRPDGLRIVTAGLDGTARLWDPPPPPVEGEAEQVILWTQIITGLELGAAGAVHLLDAETWRQRRDQLDALGGPPIP